MKGIKLCKKCNIKITPEQKGVLLMTFKGNTNLEKVYWHFDCYLSWIDKSVELRANENITNAMKVVAPGIENIVKHINKNGATKYNIYSMGSS